MSNASRSTLASVCLLASALLFFALSVTTNAQVTAVAQVSGQVTDSTGAAIVNADVSMTELSKHEVHTTKSDASGGYTLSNLPVGAYRFEVRAPGFKDYIQTGLELVVNNNIQVNAPMQ